MTKSSTINFIIPATSAKQASLADLFFTQTEKGIWKKTQLALSKMIKKPSQTSLRIIREHSLKTSTLLQA